MDVVNSAVGYDVAWSDGVFHSNTDSSWKPSKDRRILTFLQTLNEIACICMDMFAKMKFIVWDLILRILHELNNLEELTSFRYYPDLTC